MTFNIHRIGVPAPRPRVAVALILKAELDQCIYLSVYQFVAMDSLGNVRV